MILLSHTITGAIIGQKLGNPYLISIIALVSHFLLDMIPHWNYDIPGKFSSWKFMHILPDIIPSILIYLVFLFSFPDQWLNVNLGVCFAILPDFLTLTKLFPGLKDFFKPLNKFHKKIQRETKTVFTGLTTQIIYISLLIVILIYL